ncbi:MAG: hypothetical protein K2L35_01820 [Muribaculaceae bacterium]|nr:hypothetical protein [Muribaculaceae bacterium]MDE6447036.1 hypothetical protein [Muribaculaceae bacterium]MDE7343325.1 hypothetical protein [Muribaculaceae bacterium]
MVYKFKLVSDEVSNFAREIEIDSESSFLQLRNVILDSVDYTKDELDSFFICDDDWSRNEEITLEDMGSSSDQDVWLMDDTPLSEFLEDEGQKLMFMFDYMMERSFFMELKEIVPGRTLLDPICTLKRGKAPKQESELPEMDAHINPVPPVVKEEDLDADFFGDAEFNDDELAELNDDIDFE